MMRLFIVGGVAGGASCAARARRLSEEATITVVERGAYVSFANCGLPYYVGHVIRTEKDLVVATPDLFKNRFNIDVRLESEVMSIDRSAKKITIKKLETGEVYEEEYDVLVLSPGAKPIRPPLPGIDLPGIFSLRTIPDSHQIREWIKEKQVGAAVIVGGGFIGLEMAENLVIQGIKTTLVELQTQLMPPMDPEMTVTVQAHLKAKGVEVILGDSVKGFEKGAGDQIKVLTANGQSMDAGLVILAIGVTPENQLAKAAGLNLGSRGGIVVDRQMKTNDDSIWAVGDAIVTSEYLSGKEIAVPLAGPANRQGRVAADVIFGKESHFRGVQATAICNVFDLTIAMTGLSEKSLQAYQMPYEKIYLHPGQHVSYFPGAHAIHIKLLFDPQTGRVLGAQAVGQEGVDKRIDVIAMAIQMKASVMDLEEAELCYAPQFGSAKDPVNFSGMIGANILRGDLRSVHANELNTNDFLLDVRSAAEFKQEHIPGAINIPLEDLRQRIDEVKDAESLCVYCGVGQRGYYALRLLQQKGVRARNMSGGIETWKMFQSVQRNQFHRAVK